MQTTRERNQAYYEANKEKEKVRCLNRYHQIKDTIDREEKKVYMKEYLKTYKRKPKTPEQIEERNRKRRERYANDLEYRDRERQHAMDYNASHPETKRTNRLKLYFGITPQQYNELLLKQGGVCAICGKKMGEVGEVGKRKHSMYVDHDHQTGKVRGILCNRCNFGLGQFLDNPETLKKAAEYLINFSYGAT
jgi:hypothetical protein